MFRYFAENITFVLIKNKVLNIEKRDTYMYAIEVILLNSILLLTFLGVSIVGKNLLLFVGFLLFFIPIRTFAGGYHAKHSEVCFGMSLGIYIVAMIIYNHFPNLYKTITSGTSYTAHVVAQKSKSSNTYYDVSKGHSYKFVKGTTYKMINYVKESGYKYAAIAGNPNYGYSFKATGVWSPDSI